MKLVFCGTPQFAVPSLRALLESGFDVSLVVSQPDRPSGRGMQVVPTPVKQVAVERGIEVTQPEKIKNNSEFRAQLEKVSPDAIVVVAYGRIIPEWMIKLPLLGNINAHASLLPKYRGAAPIQWAIAMGETVTGVTMIRIDAGLDTGDMFLRREVPIAGDDTAVTLAPKLAQVGADLLVETLRGLEAGTLKPVPQDGSKATLAPILVKEDGQINFQRTASTIWNRLRGFQPWPGAYTTFRGKQLNVTSARPLPSGSAILDPGAVRSDCGQLFVGCGQLTTLEILEVQPEGKKRMSAKDFVNGHRPREGEKLGL